jgi:26S proteasome regulatory subunit (ATPase 3-interacting protein)
VDTAETVSAADEEIQALQDELSGMKNHVKELREHLAVVSAIISMNDLGKQISRLEEEKASSLDRLSKLQGDRTACISAEEMAHVDTDWKTWQHHVQCRERIFRELWAKCTEELPNDTTEEELRVCRLPCIHYLLLSWLESDQYVCVPGDIRVRGIILRTRDNGGSFDSYL